MGKATGFGSADRKLSDALSRASDKDQADQAAKDGGFKDAADAERWLKDRS